MAGEMTSPLRSTATGEIRRKGNALSKPPSKNIRQLIAIKNDVFVGWLQNLSESGFAGFKDFQDGGTCDESHDYEQEGEAFLLGGFCGLLRISQETPSPIADG